LRSRCARRDAGSSTSAVAPFLHKKLDPGGIISDLEAERALRASLESFAADIRLPPPARR
jgi:hypothetical protein